MPNNKPRYKIGQTVYLLHGRKIVTGVVLESIRRKNNNFNYSVLTKNLKLKNVRQAKLFDSKAKLQKKLPPESTMIWLKFGPRSGPTPTFKLRFRIKNDNISN